jgi:hypothetical protein
MLRVGPCFVSAELSSRGIVRKIKMFTFVLWCLLLIACWPLALLALVLYPVVWLILLPFRLLGFAVRGILHLIWDVVTLPFQLIHRMARA